VRDFGDFNDALRYPRQKRSEVFRGPHDGSGIPDEDRAKNEQANREQPDEVEELTPWNAVQGEAEKVLIEGREKRSGKLNEAEHEAVLSRRQAMRWIGLEYEARRGRRTIAYSGGKVLTASFFGSRGEIGHQLYKELGAGKLDSVYFQSVPTDEAKRAGCFLWRLDAALATLE
jgi:hypothetical protein